MNTLKIALLQISACDTLAETLEKGLEHCRIARDMGADIALFPEMFSNGYRLLGRRVEDWKAEAISADSELIEAFGKLARELGLAIGITFLEDYQGQPRNSMVLFDRLGRRQLTYAKVHTCDFDVERNLLPGEDFYVTDLDTALGTVKVGAMICYDREFPESARILMLKGAELILVPNACPMEINRLCQLRSRAYENMTAIATCNYPGPEGGGSTLFDGVAYGLDDGKSRDMCVLHAGDGEGIYLAELDLDLLRAFRENEVHGNAYRHPGKYGILAEKRIEPPFVRSDYRE